MDGLIVDGRHRLGTIIGKGRGSTVYRAIDTRFNKNTIVKLLVEDIALTEDFNTKFLDIMKPFALLNDEHLVGILDYGLNGNMPFIVLENFDRPNLEQLFTANGPMTPAQAAPVLQGLAQALDYIHRHSLTHLEVKPGNAWLTGNSASLGDFFMAALRNQMDAIRLQKGYTIEGYLRQPYPEMFRGEALTGASDQYGLGAAFFRLLTGVPPFMPPTTNENGEYFRWIETFKDSQPPDPRQFKPELPKNTAEIILRALALRPAERFSSCGEFAEAFTRSLQGPAFTAPQPLFSPSAPVISPPPPAQISPINIEPPAPPVNVPPPVPYLSVPPPPVLPVYVAPPVPYINPYQPHPSSLPEQLEETVVAPRPLPPPTDILHPPPAPVETPPPVPPAPPDPDEPVTPPPPARIGDYAVLKTLNSITGSQALTLLGRVGERGREVVLEYVGQSAELFPEAQVKSGYLMQKVQDSFSLRHTGILQPFDMAYETHSNIMQKHGSGLEPANHNYVVFPRLKGQTLRERLQEVGNGPVPLFEVNYVLSQLAPALDFAHWCGIEHGRVNPDDILRDERNLVILRNFGIERLREHLFSQDEGQPVHFNSHYCSPEEWNPDINRMLDPNIRLGVIDQYSLGLIVYEMLTGRQPLKLYGFFSPDWKAIPDIRQFNPQIPAQLAGVISRALAYDWRIRFGSVGEFAAAFRRAAGL